MKKRWIKAILWLALLLMTGGLLVLLFLHQIADSAGKKWLREHGISEAAFTIRTISQNLIDIEGVKLGSGDNLSADRITITYAPDQLRQGKVETIEVNALALKSEMKESRPSLGELDNLMSSGDTPSDTPVTLPFHTLVIHGLTAEVAQEKEPVTLELDTLTVEALEDGTAKVSVENAWLKHGDQEFSGMNGTVALASLSPPATQPNQQLSLRYANIGTLLADITLRFTLKPDGWLNIHNAEANWGGGKLFAEDAKINIHGTGRQTVVLKARDIDLSAVVNVVGIAGLETSGHVQGRLPVIIDGGNIMVEHGNLSTVAGGGIIHYLPASDAAISAGMGDQTDLLLKAVENFHYQILALDIHSNAPNQLSVKVHLQGNNPDLYEGKPVHLNINLQGDLVEIIKNTLNIYDIPSRIEESIHAKP